MRMKKYFNTILFCILIFCFLSTGSLSAQTKQETIEFIERKINDDEIIDICKNKSNDGIETTTTYYHKISLSGCIVTYTKLSRFEFSRSYPNMPSPYEKVVNVVDLSKIDPTRVEVDIRNYDEICSSAYYITLWATEGKKAVMQTIYSSKISFNRMNKRGPYSMVIATINASSERELIQLKKAFIHLIKLCGGKGELF
jgi:hypothetical protein